MKSQAHNPDEGAPKAPKLLDQVRSVIRLHHYSIHTERSYIDWIKRFVLFHQMRSRDEQAVRFGRPEASPNEPPGELLRLRGEEAEQNR